MAFNSESSTRSGILSSAREPEQAVAAISSLEYARFCSFLEKNSGIVLGKNKEYLVTNRLRACFEETGKQSLTELLNFLEAGGQNALRSKVVDAMTTNETLWFRDTHPFDILKDTLLPELSEQLRGKSQPIRIWSAASSTGQEAYSISITISEYLKKNLGKLPQKVEIVGTDISQNALQQAKQAAYDEYEVTRGLSVEHQRQYFDRNETKLQLNSEIKQRVRFQELNLLQSYSLLGKFEIIFCRNVLIYFSNEIKSDILSRMANALKPGGYLFLGGSEPIANYSDQFDMVRCKQGVVYRLK